MKVSREQNAQNHKMILEAASRLFRERGFDEVSVGDLMKEAGLTHGGFYGHFSSKSALAAEACRLAFHEAPLWSEEMPVESILDAYLSVKHRDHPGKGCPLAGFVGTISGQEKVVQREFASGIGSYLGRIADRISHQGLKGTDARKQALAVLSMLTGALLLSRSLRSVDPDLSASVLKQARNAIKEQFRI